jgi:hypothetical protein
MTMLLMMNGFDDDAFGGRELKCLRRRVTQEGNAAVLERLG